MGMSKNNDSGNYNNSTNIDSNSMDDNNNSNNDGNNNNNDNGNNNNNNNGNTAATETRLLLLKLGFNPLDLPPKVHSNKVWLEEREREWRSWKREKFKLGGRKSQKFEEDTF